MFFCSKHKSKKCYVMIEIDGNEKKNRKDRILMCFLLIKSYIRKNMHLISQEQWPALMACLLKKNIALKG